MVETIRIVAIDPGGTTGWCILHVPLKAITRGLDIDYSRHECGEVTGTYNEQTDFLVDLFREPAHDRSIVVMESFTLRQLQVELSPLEIAARVEYSIYDHGWPVFYHTQGASEAKTTATDARLRRWGLWEIGKEHARDANRHAATLARKLQTDRKLLQRLAPWVG
jgi:hypothetical protein